MELYPAAATWGSVATWVSGIATLAAVLVALLATQRAQKQARELQEREWKRADDTVQRRCLALTRAFIQDCRHEQDFLARFKRNLEAIEGRKTTLSQGNEELRLMLAHQHVPMIRRFLDDMSGFPVEVQVEVLETAARIRSFEYADFPLAPTPDFSVLRGRAQHFLSICDAAASANERLLRVLEQFAGEHPLRDELPGTSSVAS